MTRKKKKFTALSRQFSIREKWTLRAVEGLCFLFGSLGMFSCIEISEMDNNFQGATLFILFSVFGLILAAIANVYLRKLLPIISLKEPQNNSLIAAGLFTGFASVTPALANYYNRTNPKTEVVCQEYRVIRKGENTYRGHSYYLFVDIDNTDERLETNKMIWSNTAEGGQVELCIATGGLGFKFVKEIRPSGVSIFVPVGSPPRYPARVKG